MAEPRLRAVICDCIHGWDCGQTASRWYYQKRDRYEPRQEGKFPLLTGVSFASDRFCAVTTRVDEGFTDGDVYGVFILPYTGIDGSNPHSAPATFELIGNYPNPFNASTSIKYTLPQNAHVEIAIYNIQGQLVRTLSKGEESTGTHLAIWDRKDTSGKDVSSGVYFCQLKTPTGVLEIRKMLLLR